MAERRAGNSGEAPVGARLVRMPGRFPGGGWRAGRGWKRPGMTGSGGHPPGLRNEPNCRKQKLNQKVTTDRADRRRRGSPGSVGKWRNGKSEGRSGLWALSNLDCRLGSLTTRGPCGGIAPLDNAAWLHLENYQEKQKVFYETADERRSSMPLRSKIICVYLR